MVSQLFNFGCRATTAECVSQLATDSGSTALGPERATSCFSMSTSHSWLLYSICCNACSRTAQVARSLSAVCTCVWSLDDLCCFPASCCSALCLSCSVLASGKDKVSTSLCSVPWRNLTSSLGTGPLLFPGGHTKRTGASKRTSNRSSDHRKIRLLVPAQGPITRSPQLEYPIAEA